MKLLLPIIFIFLFITACLHRADKLSHEPGVVIGKSYRPDNYYSTYEMQQVWTGNGYTWMPVMHTHYDPAVFDVIFRCQHGVIFTIDRPELFAKLREGDTVQIDYYELLNKKGEVKDYDFVDANKFSKKQTW